MIEQPKHDARARENPDPHEMGRPVPRIVLIVVFLVLAWAITYIVTTQKDDAPELGDNRTMATLQGKAPGAGGSADGGQIFAANCVACHQAPAPGCRASSRRWPVRNGCWPPTRCRSISCCTASAAS